MFFTIIIILFGCEKGEDISDIPQRPESIPNESIWVGGHDGGVFVFIRSNGGPNLDEYFGEIYYVSGDLAYKGLLYLYPQNSDGFDINNPESYQGWDGDTIYLINNKTLKILE